jgi:hypothetical protein
MKAASAVALALLVVCALDGLSSAGPGADEPPPPEASGPPGPPETGGAPVAPGTTGAGGSSAGLPGGPGGLLNRRQFKRWQRRQGGPDGGVLPAHDGGYAARDGGVPDAIAARIARVAPRVVAPPPPPPPAPPPPAPVVPSTPSTSQPVTELGFNTCQKIKSGKRVVNVNLKPEVELPELVAWISSITCKSFILPGHLSGAGKKVTFVAHGAMTREEAFAAFLSAIDTLGLTIERGPGYLKIIETSKAKMSSVPVYGFDGRPTRAKE